MENKKEIIAKEALNALVEIEDTVRMENIIKDNKIEFKVNEITYRVRKPNSAEQQEINEVRRKKYLEFVKDPSYLFKKQWIAQYKEKGIDIVGMENRIRGLHDEIREMLLRLAKSVEPKDISLLKDEILKKRDEEFSISIEMTDLLAHSIENQLLIAVNSYVTYLVLEKNDPENTKQGDNAWVRAYDSYESFMKSEDGCISQAFYYINYLIYNSPINIEKEKTK